MSSVFINFIRDTKLIEIKNKRDNSVKYCAECNGSGKIRKSTWKMLSPGYLRIYHISSIFSYTCERCNGLGKL